MSGKVLRTNKRPIHEERTMTEDKFVQSATEVKPTITDREYRMRKQ